MRGVARFLAIAVSFAFASELPDFREHIRASEYTGRHFKLIVVDEKRSVLGARGYSEVVRVGKPYLGYCLRHGLPIFTKVKAGGMEVEKPYPEDISLWGLATGKDADFEYTGYCKDKDGNVIISYRGNTVEHPPSKVSQDILPRVAEEKIANIKSFEDMLNTFKAKPVEKGADVYRIEGLYGWIGNDDAFNPFIAMALCRRSGGEFYRIMGGQEVRFVDYLWNIYGQPQASVGSSTFFDPGNAYARDSARSREFVQRYTGLYLCKGGQKDWTLSYRPIARETYVNHYSFVRVGIDQALVNKEIEAQRQSQPQVQVQVQPDTITLIARQVALTKTPVILQQGSMKYEGRYNGEQGGCSLVSVLVFIGTHQQATHNYRVCGERVEYVGETGLPALPRGIESVRLDVARLCQKYGSANLVYEGTTLSCRALRDKDKCLVEISYLQGGKLVKTETLNGCQ